MHRRFQHLTHGADLEYPALIHDDHVIRDLRDHTEVVGYEYHRVPEIALQVADQCQDLGLDRDVQRCCRLVTDQDLGVADERHGNHDALSHAAGKLERVHLDASCDVLDADSLEHVRCFFPRCLFAEVAVAQDGLAHLIAHRMHGRECGHGFLEHHADLTAPQVEQAGILGW